jgi:uncharacterized protein YndB with AHSA1/START domain
MRGAVATAEVDINATPVRVWDALVDPKQIRRYMFGSQVETDWHPGHLPGRGTVVGPVPR